MKRPEQMEDPGAKLTMAVKAWLAEADPVQDKDSYVVKQGEHSQKLRSFPAADFKAEAVKQLKCFGWRVISFEYERVVVAPE